MPSLPSYHDWQPLLELWSIEMTSGADRKAVGPQRPERETLEEEQTAKLVVSRVGDFVRVAFESDDGGESRVLGVHMDLTPVQARALAQQLLWESSR